MCTSQAAYELHSLLKHHTAANINLRGMGNKLSAEEPQHIKALKSKPNVLKVPTFHYYTAGWREAEFDDDAEELSFAACREPPGDDDDEEKKGTTDGGSGGNASMDDVEDFQPRRGRLKERPSACEERPRHERKHIPNEERRVQAEHEGASDRYDRSRPKELTAQQQDVLRREDASVRDAVAEIAGV